MGYRKQRVVSPLKLPAMQVPTIFYKSTNIVLHENRKGICSGQMVPTPKFTALAHGPFPSFVGIRWLQSHSVVIYGPDLTVTEVCFVMLCASHL